MKYIVTLIWGFILGQVSFYIGSALEGNAYNFIGASLLGIFVAAIVIGLTIIFPKNKSSKA